VEMGKVVEALDMVLRQGVWGVVEVGHCGQVLERETLGAGFGVGEGGNRDGARGDGGIR